MSGTTSKRLLDMCEEEQREFLDSFDTVFCDVDGVLWKLGHVTIEGAADGLKALRNLGKKLHLVTNNSTVPMEIFLARLKQFEVVKHEIIRPANALAWYLKQQNFDKEVYVLGFETLRNDLKSAGLRVVHDEISPVEETADTILERMSLRPNVGAVIVDFAVNMNYISLQKCVEYINKNNALFLVGAWDPVIPFRGLNLIGNSQFAKIITEITGESPIILSKPGIEFNNFLEGNLGPLDPKRTLFIGDSPVTDMKFAANHGYQKLMPLTGFTTAEDLDNWKYDERSKPDYVVSSLKDFHTVVCNLGLNKTPSY